MNPYRKRVLERTRDQLKSIRLPRNAEILDFGAGDGWFASQISQMFPDANIHAVDVQSRKELSHFKVDLVAPDAMARAQPKSYDLVYEIDVLHHCDDPKAVLVDLMRVSRGYLMLKDHIAFNSLDHFALGVMDEIGNRKFGIPSNYNYQRGWEWENILHEAGWKTVEKMWPLPCHIGLMGALTNRYQFLAVYQSPVLTKINLRCKL